FTEGYWARNTLRFPGSITDGTSNTIFYTEKLAHCNNVTDFGTFSDAYINNYWPDWGPIIQSSDHGDPTGPAVSPPFQVQPKSHGPGQGANCRGALASSSHTAGMNVGLGDGSVRFLSGSMSSATWWYALTPNGGEVLG